MAIQRLVTPEGTLPFGLLREHQFAWVAAEQMAELDGLGGRPVVAQGFEASGELMPQLFELSALSDEQLAQWVHNLDQCHALAQQPPVCVLLRTEASADAITEHLRAHQTRSFLGQRAWLRLHDPYVFMQLPRVLGEAAMRAVMGPIDTWTVCLRGQWHACRMQPAAPDAPRAQRSRAELGRQWSGLLRIGAVNRALFQRDWVACTSVIAHSEHLDKLVQRAMRRHALNRPTEQAAFAALGAECQIDFDEHPDIAHALTEHQREQEQIAPEERMETNALDALQALPPDVWERVRRDRPHLVTQAA